MVLRRLLSILGPCLFLAGCNGPFELAWRTVVTEPRLFCDSRDRIVMHAHHYRLATAAWEEMTDGQQGQGYSNDYGCGFKEGFADYLDAGGTGEPPSLPPRRYWHHGYRTPEGHRAIEDWFAGFRYGAACAQESGLRHFAVIPSSLPTANATAQFPVQAPPEPPQEVVPAPFPAGAARPPVNEPSRPASPRPVSQPRRQEGPTTPILEERP